MAHFIECRVEVAVELVSREIIVVPFRRWYAIQLFGAQSNSINGSYLQAQGVIFCPWEDDSLILLLRSLL